MDEPTNFPILTPSTSIIYKKRRRNFSIQHEQKKKTQIKCSINFSNKYKTYLEVVYD